MAQQYGGYNQVGYGSNPYDQRDNDGPDGGRYNNYSQGRYDDRTSAFLFSYPPHAACSAIAASQLHHHHSRYHMSMSSSNTSAAGSVEMQPYGNQQGGGADPNAILNECREVDRALDQLDSQLDTLERMFKQVLARPDMSNAEITGLSTQVMTGYRALVARVKNIKSKPESGNPRNAPQVGKVDRRLKATINKYQTLEADFRRDSQAAAERQFRIVNPNATDAEVREAVEDPNAQVFQQAVRKRIS